tara:strand:- start:20 stop:292 length:273 start_codon:yes stop_codon:yes gene_type:complete
MAIDIDDLKNIDNPTVLGTGEDNSSKRFSDSLSEVEKEAERKNNKIVRTQNSQEVDDLMATIPADVAEKFKDLKNTLEMIDKKKPDDAKS